MRLNRLGYKKDSLDLRDFSHRPKAGQSLPPSLDLSMTGCLNFQLDQKATSSCVAHATAAGIRLLECRDAEKDLANPSRLFIYYHARAEQGWQNEDAGCQIRDALKTAARYGVADEKAWPFKINTFGFGSGNINKKPSEKAYADAAARKSPFAYKRVDQNEYDLKATLAAGFPIVAGLYWHSGNDSRDAARTGKIVFPSPLDKDEGGHAVLIVGYNDKDRYFKFKNSWGASWGASGYGFVPYEYLTSANLAFDIWALTDC